MFEQKPILVGSIFHLGRSHGCCPVRGTGGSLPCGRYLLATLTGIKDGSKGLMVLRVKPTPTRFPIKSLYTPMDNTPLHSISSVCHPWSVAVVADGNRAVAASAGDSIVISRVLTEREEGC